MDDVKTSLVIFVTFRAQKNKIGGGLGRGLCGGIQRGLQRGLQTGLGRGLAVKLRSVKVQVRSGSV